MTLPTKLLQQGRWRHATLKHDITFFCEINKDTSTKTEGVFAGNY
jgi:hypothetical protein